MIDKRKRPALELAGFAGYAVKDAAICRGQLECCRHLTLVLPSEEHILRTFEGKVLRLRRSKKALVDPIYMCRPQRFMSKARIIS